MTRIFTVGLLLVALLSFSGRAAEGEAATPAESAAAGSLATTPSNAVVRIAYVVPGNRVPQAHAVTTLRNIVRRYQEWFADQMELNGFGRKTFAFETEPDGVTPLIHVLSVPRSDDFLRGDIHGSRVLDAARAAGVAIGSPGQLWWLIPETHAAFPDGTISGSFEFGRRAPAAPADSGWAMSGSDRLALYQSVYHTNALIYEDFTVPEIGPYPLVEDVSFPWFEGTSLSAISSSAVGGGLRSLAEAFGLDTDYRNDENFNGNVMGFGFRGIRGVFYPKEYPYNYCGLSYASALALDVNPFFNPSRLATDTNAPAATITTTGERTPVSGLIQINFQASDDRALHAAVLAWERDGELVVIDEMTLSGQNVTRSFSVPYFNAEQTNRYTVTVFDRHGNRHTAQTGIYPRASVNRSPQPFIIVSPLIAGPGQDIVLDASETFDPEHSAGLLEVEWDLDGDGFFDTFPVTQLVFTNNYFSLGTRVIRARITDPAGATAVSAPVAVSIIVCPTTLSPLTRFHGFAGSTGVIEVTVGPKCNWSVVNTNDWITIRSGASGAGSGEVIYDVHPNPLFAQRQGTLRIGDETFLVRQHAVECTFSLSPTNRFHGFGASIGTIRVTTKADCAWLAVNTNSWISITSGSEGVGTGTVSYAISTNRVIGRRAGNIVIGGETFTVNQWGLNCELALNVTGRAHSELSETGLVSVTTGSGCTWSAENTNSWITITTASLGTNTGSFGYLVAANPSLTPRTGVMTINGQSFTVTQGACSYAITPSSRTHSYLAQTGSVAVAAGGVCPWTASSSSDWITLLNGASGPGASTVVYAVSQNLTSNPRTAALTMAGRSFTVTQSGKPCAYLIEPEDFSHGEAGGLGEFFVTAESGCFWSVDNSAPWVEVLAGETGEGSGRVSYRVSANDGPERHTTLTVGGQEYVISQASAVRVIGASSMTVASGQTNCVAITLSAHGGENNLRFSLCFDTNLLVFRSARLQPGAPAGAALTVNSSPSSSGRLGFTLSMPAGASMAPGAQPAVQVCLSARAFNGQQTTALSICDTPVARQLVDAAGRALPASFAGGFANVIGLCSLAESLDTAQFNWTFSGTPWSCQTNITHDGVDAAVSGATPDDGESYMQTTVNGPGVVSFWWKVSSEQDSDRLRLYLDGDEQFRISGETDWEWRTLNVAAGSHTLRWRYSKGGSGLAGSDRGWVDEITYQVAPPSITTQPASQNLSSGATATFRVVAAGQPPLTYQWLFNGVALSDGGDVGGARTATLTLSNVQPARAGAYSVIVANAAENIASVEATLIITAPISLAEAVDATNQIWVTTGSANWVGQPTETRDGVDAARSGAITHSQTTSLETTVNGPGTARYWWKVSSEPANDRLAFFVNGAELSRISGEVEWEERTFAIGAGAQTLRWSYTKNASTSSGQDRGWVDFVQFIPAPVALTSQPMPQSVDAGATAIFAIAVGGAPPFSYRWQLNGIPLVESATVRGTTTATLTLGNVQLGQAGNYSVLVSNPGGGATSSNALLTISQLVPLAEAIDATSFVWTTNGPAPWVGQPVVTHDGADAARSGRIGDSQTTSFQTTVLGPGAVSFWWKVSSEASDGLRFYVNGLQQDGIAGEVDWTWRSRPVGSGNQVLEWRYVKNSSASGGQDRGWVDQIKYVAASTPEAPFMGIQPTNQTIVAPATVGFIGMAGGSEPLSYQWHFNGVPLLDGNGVSGATTTNLTLTGAGPAQAGDYSLVVTNAAGSLSSSIATLTVVTAPVITLLPEGTNVVAGSTVNFNVSALGMAPLSYQWMRNGTNLPNGGRVSGATTAHLTVSNVQEADEGIYSVLVSNAVGVVTSLESGTLVIWDAARTAAIAHDESTALKTTVTGPGTIRFSWKVSSQTNSDSFQFLIGPDEQARISGEVEWRTEMFAVPSGDQAIEWRYTKDGSGAVGQDAGFVDGVEFTPDGEIEAPMFMGRTETRTVGTGATMVLDAAVNGSLPLTYQWIFNGTPLLDGGAASGAKTPRLILTGVQAAHAGSYSILASNSAGSVGGSVLSLIVTSAPSVTVGAPVITIPPFSQSVSENSSVSFSVAAAGAPPLTYRWQFNGANLADGIGVIGAATASLSLTNVQPSRIGDYSVVVSNAVGVSTSSVASLTVLTLAEAAGAPYLNLVRAGDASWLAQPIVGGDAVRSGVIADGGNSRLETWVDGPGIVTFRWRVSSEPGDELRFYIGTTEISPRITGEVGWQQRSHPVPSGTRILLKWRYGKNVSGSAGEDAGWVDDMQYVYTGGAIAPGLTNHPVSQNVLAGATIAFTGGADGSLPLSYQWRWNGTDIQDGGGVSGAKTPRLTLTGVQPAQAGSYSLFVSNAAGNVSSFAASLGVTPFFAAPIIVNHPAGKIVNEGVPVSFQAGAAGAEPLSYGWQFNGTKIIDGDGVSGATTPILTLSSVRAGQVGNYSLWVSNAAGVATSADASLTLLSVSEVAGAPYLNFSVSGDSSWLRQNGQTFHTDGTNEGARLIVSTPPSFTSHPTSQTAVLGTSVDFTVGIAGTPSLHVQWRRNGTPLANSDNISGVTETTLRLSAVQAAAGGTYSAVLSNAVGMAISSNAILSVLTPPSITTAPVSRNVSEGATATFGVVATGTAPLTYRWRRNGTNLVNGGGISGASTATLTLSNAQPSQSDAYSVEVSNAAGSTESSYAQLTVIPKLTLGVAVNAPYLDWKTSGAIWTPQNNVTHDGDDAAQSGSIGNGSNTWMETTVTGPGTIRFWWKVSSQTNADALVFSVNGAEWERISGIVDWQRMSFILPPGALTLRWTYAKNGSTVSGFDRGWLDEVDFLPTVSPSAPVIVSEPVSQDVDPGATVTFAVEALGTGPVSYQWRFEGQNLSDGASVFGATSPTLRLFNVQVGQSGLYDVVVRNPYSVKISEQAFLDVAPVISLPVSLDTDFTNLTWRTGGFSPWRGQASVSADRIDAAQSGPLVNNATNWTQTTIAGPCALTFWWKVSSQTNSDRLRFLVDGVEQANISGEVGWQQRAFPIEAATATIRWEYVKNASGVAGQDRGWVDRMEMLAISPLITNAAPNTNIVDQGTTVRYKVDASGSLPLLYQWRHNGTNLTNTLKVIGATTSHRIILSNAQPNQTGFYTCVVANEAGIDTSEQMYLRVNPVTTPIGPAVNNTNLIWETGGWSWFFSTTDDSHNDNQSVRNGYVDDGFSTWMRTTVTGPGTVGFWWRASTQPNADIFKFSINGLVQTQISGNVSWQQRTFPVPDGVAVLQWEYAKDLLLTNGSDRVWVDDVTYTLLPPSITNQPLSQAVDLGSTVTLAAGVRGAPPILYRWRYNGVPLTDSGNISGALTPTLRITGVQLSQAGSYSLFVSNRVGTITSSNAVLTVTPVLPLSEGLDATSLAWATGSPGWIGQPLVTHDGVDAARSPALGDNQLAAAQATVTGPATVSFWWRVSSQTNADYLIFHVGNTEQARISGEVNWQQRTFNVPAGNHALGWTYSKNGTGAAGQDRGWVDQFVFTPTSPSITLQPVSQTVEEGARVTFTTAATGLQPIAFQWRFNGANFADGGGVSGARTTTLTISNASLARSGTYSVFLSNAAATAMSADATLLVTPIVTLAVALDEANLNWTTNGTAPWTGQSLVSHDGTDAARSGVLANNGSNSIQTTVSGPASLSFWWKVSSEPVNDRLMFLINNVEQARISGESNWAFRTFNLGAGSQTLRWTYAKNGSAVGGQDRAWVDQVSLAPLSPAITSQPTNQNVDAGATVNFRVAVGGTPPFSYQWQRDGSDLANGNGISGATSSNLVLTGVQVSQAGSYRVIVSNAVGSTSSAAASLDVFPVLPLAAALDTTGVTWTTTGTPPWTGHGAVTRDGIDAARSGAIGNSTTTWMETTVNGPDAVNFWWKVSSQANNDLLVFTIDGVEQARISGEVDWSFRSFSFGSGSHVLRWTYSKNGSTVAGQDRGWVDQVRFGTVAPTIATQPASRLVNAGDSAAFSVSAAGTAPLGYRWFFNGVQVANGGGISGATTATLTIANVQAAQLGSYSVAVSNSAGTAVSAPATLAFIPSLAEALDAPALTFTAGGTAAPWSGQRAVTHDFVDAAQTGTMTSDSTYTWIKTTVNGPGTLTFWWKVSSEDDHDYLRFMLDAVDQVRIAGEVDWHQITFEVPSGSHELQWRYSRSPGGVARQDRGWVDQISFGNNPSPAPVQAPDILIQPVSQTVDEDETVTVNIAATGSDPLGYQWFFNGTNAIADGGNLGGATAVELTLFNALAGQSGNYSVVVSNVAGAATSIVARLTVNPLFTLAEAVDAPELLFVGDGEAVWEGHGVVTHDGTDAARSGLVGDGQSSSMQTIIDGPCTLSFWWKVSSETNADSLVLSLNGQPGAFISGEVDWEQRSFDLPSGPQFIEWTYFKNGAAAAGEDRGWVDQVSYAPGSEPVSTGAMAPRIAVIENKAVLTWEAGARRSYEVLYKDDLSDPEWKRLDSEVLATRKVAEDAVQPEIYTAIVEDLLTTRTRYYRVLKY